MDWATLARHLEDGEKVYKVFQDGQIAASQIANAERYLAEIQAKMDTLPTQMEQVMREIQAMQDSMKAQKASLESDYLARKAKLDADYQAVQASAQGVLASLRAEIAGVSDQARLAHAQHETLLASLQTERDAVRADIVRLQAIKDSLKHELESIH